LPGDRGGGTGLGRPAPWRLEIGMDQTVDYICPHCGEAVQLPVDPTAGDDQQFIEDCPICCHPNAIRITLDAAGFAAAEAEPAQ
jgi:hypothetical protein